MVIPVKTDSNIAQGGRHFVNNYWQILRGILDKYTQNTKRQKDFLYTGIYYMGFSQ